MLEVLQIAKQLFCGLIALVYLFAQRLGDDPLQYLRSLGHEPGERRWLFFEYRNDDVARRFAGKRNAASDHFVEQHAQTPGVSACIDIQSARLFRRHVVWRTHDHTRLRTQHGRRLRLAARGGEQLGQAEVQYLYDAILAQHDVLRLDVTMDDSGLMRCGQRRRDLRGNTEQFTDRDWRLNHALPQGVALDEFGGDELMRIYLADLENRQDVGVIQR